MKRKTEDKLLSLADKILIVKFSFGFLLVMFAAYIIFGPLYNSVACEGSVYPWINDDLVYVQTQYHFLWDDYTCEKKSKIEMTKENVERLKKQKELAELNLQKEVERKACYDQGYDFNITLDLIEDYGYSCEQISYINDHLIENTLKKKSGSISGSMSGFLSYGRVEGEFYQWINEHNLATDKLIKTSIGHKDCNGNTLYWKIQHICANGKVFMEETSSCYNGKKKLKDTMINTYYTEQDFVMYYVNRCLE